MAWLETLETQEGMLTDVIQGASGEGKVSLTGKPCLPFRCLDAPHIFSCMSRGISANLIISPAR